VRGVGYHESVAGELDRDRLDAIVADRPVRVQHRSGAQWVCNSLALSRLGLTDSATTPDGTERDTRGRLTGRLWRLDDWIQTLPVDAVTETDIAGVGRQLTSYGITGVTDATPDLDLTAIELFEKARANGSLPQRLVLLGAPQETCSPHYTVGPRKLVLDEAALPDFDAFCETLRDTHAAGRPVAVHCVTAATASFFVAALNEVGPRAGDRMEHGAVLSPGLVERLAQLDVAVVTQPLFVRDRGVDYLRDVEPANQPYLYPHASLCRAGVAVAPSSDAPYADPDPWQTIAAARDRTSGAVVVGSSERVPAATALDGYLSDPLCPGRGPRRITVGADADLCLLHGSLEAALDTPTAEQVRRTFIGGRTVFADDVSS
jgi:predicted amidohydrolase YtcJ